VTKEMSGRIKTKEEEEREEGNEREERKTKLQHNFRRLAALIRPSCTGLSSFIFLSFLY